MTCQRTTLNVSVTRELKKFIASLVRLGKYKLTSEVVREWLRLLDQRVRCRTSISEMLKNDLKEKGHL
ncbi:ribbon-helix-helix domain-containing protein [Scytonema sp. PRP1]|uniref:ribbon-helix-helix domain-containing protein n=1 Tax=Scytonema sp. PRP1 TaxID=3120513 RepID=UPI002FCEACF9